MAQEQGDKGNFAKRDFLVKIQQESQNLWDKLDINNVDSDVGKEKFMVTLPPYYACHDITILDSLYVAKADFIARYQTMLGKKVLFPYFFQGIGKFIPVYCEGLAKELQEFGCPPEFPEVVEKSKHYVRRMWTDVKRILQIDDPNEIQKFTDPQQWLNHFTTEIKSTLSSFGAMVDWRRSFINTKVNHYYDSFVRWQFDTLKAQGKIRLGKQRSLYSPKSKYSLGGHDLISGEDAVPLERLHLKLPLVPSSNHSPLSPLFFGNYKLFLFAYLQTAEVVYGITNVWVSPSMTYGAYLVNDTDVFLCNQKAALNLSYQGFAREPGKPECLVTVTGNDLLGFLCVSPITSRYLFVLPLIAKLPEYGSGIHLSVPTNNYRDNLMLQNLQKQANVREKLGVQESWVVYIAPTPFLSVIGVSAPGMERVPANAIDDIDKVSQYYITADTGVILIGPHANKTVASCRKLIKEELLQAKHAVSYFEPSSKAISRQYGDECVVLLIEKWYIAYDDAEWRAQAQDYINKMETNVEPEVLGNSREWICTLSSANGPIPDWDSSRTINPSAEFPLAPAYCTISHLLQGGVFGSETGRLGVLADQITNEVWDYILLGRPYPIDCGIPEATLSRLRREFQFWYPLDLSISHRGAFPTLYTVFNHVALFPQEAWPKEIQMINAQLDVHRRTVGLVLLKDEITKRSADATRMAIAGSGDSDQTRQYLSTNVDSFIRKLFNFVSYTKTVTEYVEVDNNNNNNSSERKHNFFDQLLESTINQCIAITRDAYEKQNYKTVLDSGFHLLSQASKDYKRACECLNVPPLRSLLVRHVEVLALLLAPIAPHTCEHVWGVLGKSGSITRQLFPTPGPVNADIMRKQVLLRQLQRAALHIFSDNDIKKDKNAKQGRLYVYVNCPVWHRKVLGLLVNYYKECPTFSVLDTLDHFTSHLPEVPRKFIIATLNKFQDDINEGRDPLSNSPEDLVSFADKNPDIVAAFIYASEVIIIAEDIVARPPNFLILPSLYWKSIGRALCR